MNHSNLSQISLASNLLCAAACSVQLLVLFSHYTHSTQMHIVLLLQHTLFILRDWFHVPRTELISCSIVPQNMVALPVAGWKIFTAGRTGREGEREGGTGRGERREDGGRKGGR